MDRQRLKSVERLLQEASLELTTAINSRAQIDGTLTIQDMTELREAIHTTMDQFRRQYGPIMDDYIRETAQSAAYAQSAAWEAYVGTARLTITPQFGDITQQVMDTMHRRVLGGIDLSERIWRLDIGSRNLLERELLGQLAQGSSAAKIARRIEGYLLPGRQLPKGDVPSATYSNQPRDVAYNAYRLARTEINHTWHEVRGESDKMLAKMGVVLGTRWVLSANHAERMLAATGGKTSRDICDDWAERVPGDPILKGQPSAGRVAEQKLYEALERYGIDPRGVYLPGKMPREHPNGLCHTEAVLLPREAVLAKYEVEGAR